MKVWPFLSFLTCVVRISPLSPLVLLIFVLVIVLVDPVTAAAAAMVMAMAMVALVVVVCGQWGDGRALGTGGAKPGRIQR